MSTLIVRHLPWRNRSTPSVHLSTWPITMAVQMSDARSPCSASMTAQKPSGTAIWLTSEM